MRVRQWFARSWVNVPRNLNPTKLLIPGAPYRDTLKVPIVLRPNLSNVPISRYQKHAKARSMRISSCSRNACRTWRTTSRFGKSSNGPLASTTTAAPAFHSHGGRRIIIRSFSCQRYRSGSSAYSRRRFWRTPFTVQSLRRRRLSRTALRSSGERLRTCSSCFTFLVIGRAHPIHKRLPSRFHETIRRPWAKRDPHEARRAPCASRV